MIEQIKELGIEYMVAGAGRPLVILHGWGCNKEMFRFLVERYKTKYRVYAFDLPGFGNSKEPTKVYNTKDYANRMQQVFQHLSIVNPIMIGHSFGGRVIIQMAETVAFEKIVLLSSAGVVNKRPTKYYIKVYSYKMLKKLYQIKWIKKSFPKLLEKYRKKSGSADYNNASPMMKKVLSTVVNEDLRRIFPKISAPTLLIWGELDTATPLSDAKLMEKTFQDAGLVVFQGGSHYAFLEQRERLLRILDAFI